ncbi:MAG: S1 family peptidase [Hyphomicrobiaceae bacterium]
MVDSILLSAARVRTFAHDAPLTNASGFFFSHDDSLFLVTSRHVLIDDASQHFPDRVEIDLHVDDRNLANVSTISVPLYLNGKSNWRQGEDGSGSVDIAAIEIDQSALPINSEYCAFRPEHLAAKCSSSCSIELGSPVLVVGFPLGFYDSLHHLPVARQAIVASSFGLRFQGKGYFLTDARTHQGTSGSPVVMRLSEMDPRVGDLPWMLLGVHSARLDVRNRDSSLNEALGLNCTWYADILLTLTSGAVRTS